MLVLADCALRNQQYPTVAAAHMIKDAINLVEYAQIVSLPPMLSKATLILGQAKLGAFFMATTGSGAGKILGQASMDAAKALVGVGK
jgi:hypothetical protein